MNTTKYDVVILGGGLAGLTLARQLCMTTNKSVLLIEREPQLPPRKQKVGESTIQIGGYYLSKVLDLEETLFCDHLLKYNLRFYWPTPGHPSERYESYSQTYIKQFSNICCFQIDRNKLEATLVEQNKKFDQLTIVLGADKLDIQLGNLDHQVRYTQAGSTQTAACQWIVDTSGRSRILAKQTGLSTASPIKHGASFFWVDGLIDIERLSNESPDARRRRTSKSQTGHIPEWLGTNHFMGEGYWFWVIPLPGKTSLGLVYDSEKVAHQDVGSPDKLISWLEQRFPMLTADLKQRPVLNHGFYKDIALNVSQAISPQGFAMSGEAGRLLDPLYSTGTDFIALHNSLIVAAINADPGQAQQACALYDQLLRSYHDAFVGSYGETYRALGHVESFSLKYTWELTTYFSFFVYPFINDLIKDSGFLMDFLRRFARVGQLSRSVLGLIGEYYDWLQQHRPSSEPVVHHNLADVDELKFAEAAFYRIEDNPQETQQSLDEFQTNLESLARKIAAHIASQVTQIDQLGSNDQFLNQLDFDRYDLATVTTLAKSVGTAQSDPGESGLEIFQRPKAS